MASISKDQPPFLFRGLKALSRSPFRGGYRLLRLATRLGLLSGVVRLDLNNKFGIYVPLSRHWDEQDIRFYESELTNLVAERARALPGDITLIDCGADVGLMSIRMIDAIGTIGEVIAFEPNVRSFALLERTLQELPFMATAVNGGVSDFTGLGELRYPDYDAEDEACYIERVGEGGFPVMTVDSVLKDARTSVILKIDVEGSEFATLRGARRTIAAAQGILVALEAHPKVAKRTGVDPIELLNYLATIRDFNFTVAEMPQRILELSQPFFRQLPPERVYNILASSCPGAGAA